MTTLLLAGDVMTGRGIDQVQAESVDAELHEPYVRNARRYVELAERASGPVPKPLTPTYVWGDLLGELDRRAPAVRIVNLETAITTRDDWWPTKAIHYRMHPANIGVLTAAGIDVAVLANNHVLDWGVEGLRETLVTLRDAGIGIAGAGLDARDASEPWVADVEAGRVVVHAWGTGSAGVPSAWAAGPASPGINVLGLDGAGADAVIARVRASAEPGDRVVVSLHWGGNWGYDVPSEQRALAHRLVDAEAADIVFGHSSHHPKGIEVYGERLIIYGAGDLLNDYEGIGGREGYRGTLALAYLPALASSGRLLALTMIPVRIRRFRLERASPEDVGWLAGRLGRECRPLGTSVSISEEGCLTLAW
jgi:poly-gamma-glutamate capsule biosynthesis protein CapA/YwtB (metallophosphatase superfamily)